MYKVFSRFFQAFIFVGLTPGFAAAAQSAAPHASRGPQIWELLVAAGWVIIPLVLMSLLTTALVVYHFKFVTIERLAPRDFVDNILFLLEKKEFDKATSVCKQQHNMISAIALKGLEKMSKGRAVVEGAVQYEGKARLERLWQNLTYLGDMAVIAPMLGLLGTIFGMIDAFGYFNTVNLNPSVLTSGLAKAMINTAFGLVIAVPALAFYSYFRGRISLITSMAETVSSEIVHMLTGPAK